MEFKKILSGIVPSELFGPLSIEKEDRSGLFYGNFAEWTIELKQNIALFGCSQVVNKLIEKFPNAYCVVVDLDPAKHGNKVGNVPIVSLDEYKKNQAAGIIITDVRLQYVYLDLIYSEILLPAGLVTVKGIEKIVVRYNYELKGIAYGNDPGTFDQEFLRIKRALPMECTMPADSLIRLMDCVKTSIEIDGDILEIGTGLGGSTYFMASVIESLAVGKTIYSVDPFEKEYYIPDLNFDTVANNLKRFPSVKLIKGYAPEILQGSGIDKIGFSFIDYYAFPAIMEYVYPRMVPGGMILIDNYNHGCYHNHGIPIANSFFLDKKEKIVRVGGTQGLVVKQA